MKKEDKIFSEIILNNSKIEKEKFFPYACRSDDGVRRYPKREKLPDKKNLRSIFFHDTDKIIHSLAYTRYIDKTQVFYLFNNDHLTHRVLHVQFVSKIGRVIGRCLKLNEDLIEAISLGHDLGHAPFGHEGEEALDEICQKNKIGFFRHNAQSVRLLEDIGQHGKGLNLSLQVLDGILCHNGEMINEKYFPNRKKTWKKFDEEYKNCLLKKNYSKRIFPMTLEGCVVRISDIIAYIGRDFEDAVRLKLIKREEMPIEAKKRLGDSNDKIINSLVEDLIKNSYGKEYIAFSKDIFKNLNYLRKFNFEKIYFNSKIKTETQKIKNMFWDLFKKYCEDVKNKNYSSPIYEYFLNSRSREYLKKTNNKRKVVDFISGMTDNFFNKQYEELFMPKNFGYSI